MVRVLIVGAGGHAQVVADCLIQAKEKGKSVTPIGFVDDDLALRHHNLLGLPVFGTIAERNLVSYDTVIIAIGNNAIRKTISCRLEHEGERFFTALHPSAIVASDTKIGIGTMICAGVIINPGCVIGKHVILNTACTLDHHNQVNDYVHIAPGVHTGGDVIIGEGNLIGIGSTIMPRCKIGTWSIIGAGTVVIRDVPDNVTVVGVPGKIIKQLES